MYTAWIFGKGVNLKTKLATAVLFATHEESMYTAWVFGKGVNLKTKLATAVLFAKHRLGMI